VIILKFNWGVKQNELMDRYQNKYKDQN
jgi:hypothetical protein